MEAELFGYERGAFTDAKESKLGLFEAAEGGFLFLDEIGDIELALQGKLLRPSRTGRSAASAAIRDRKIDVRILAATNRDLEREARSRIASGRTSTSASRCILLRLPPLRERGDDIPLLADHYLRHYSAKYGRDVRRINTQARELLRAYPWPGNVRELSHVMERAVLWSQGDTLDVEHLSLSTPASHSPARRRRVWPWRSPSPITHPKQPCPRGECRSTGGRNRCWNRPFGNRPGIRRRPRNDSGYHGIPCAIE